MARRREDELRIEEIGRALSGWALGLGLLRWHLAVFTVGAVALVLLELYRTPDELRADGPLRLWTVVLGCHVAALVAGWSTWRAVRPHRLPQAGAPPGTAPATRVRTVSPVMPGVRPGSGVAPNGRAPLPVAAATGAGPPPAPAAAPPAPAAAPPNGAATAIGPLPARGRFSPRASEPPVLGHHALPRLDTAATLARLQAGTAGVTVAGRAGWRWLVAVSRSSAVALAGRLSQLTSRAADRPTASVGMPPGAPPGWPTPPVVPFGPEVPRGWEGVVAPTDRPAEAVATQPPPAPTPGSSEPPLREETEWTWMEAAAASWLARHETEEERGGPADAAPAAPATTGDAGELPPRP